MKPHSFRNRLIASFLAASLVPMVICALLLFQILQMQMTNRIQNDAQIQGQAMSRSLDRIPQGLEQAAEVLESRLELTRSLTPGGRENTQTNALLFMATEGLRDLGAFQLYDIQGLQRATTRGEPERAQLPLRWGILYGAASRKELVIQSTQEPVSQEDVLLRGAVPLYVSQKAVGYLVLEMTGQDFANLLEGKFSPRNDILILSEFWHPVYASQSQMLTELAPELRQSLLHGMENRVESENDVYTLVENQSTGLSLVLRQPQLFSGTVMGMIYTAGIFCALMGIAIAGILSLSLSRQVLRPIRRLQKAFSRLGQDDLEVQVKAGQKDELGQLAQAFNEMVAALKYNQQERSKNQQELNRAQVRMLQAQLNPHFLCNTLDTMKWIAKINHLPQLALMSTNLADILRFCISAEEFVPLEREIQVLSRYIEIQKIRLSETFSFSITLPENLEDCLVPKMILQPLVENSILHGLEGVPGSWIQVEVWQQGEDLKIVVTDNGQGLPEPMVGKPYQRPDTHDGKHLGLYNVDTILKKHYGESYGLYLDRGPHGRGTQVTARLPIRRKEQDHAEGTDCGR